VTVDTLALLFHTIRYLKPSQVLHRARLRARARVRELSPAAAQRRYRRLGSRLHLSPAPWKWATNTGQLPAADASASARAADAERGRFTFLNVDGSLGRPIDWRAPGQSQLWRYKLQYGSYLVDLAGTRADPWPAIASLMRDWIRGNPLGASRDAWHPFVVSERIVNWIFAIQLTAPQSHGAADILESLAAQCALLEESLEWDVRGNHLLKNLKALAIAGCFASGDQPRAWRTKYTTMFATELAAQLLSDGSHYERSPMYHSLVLQDALELICALAACGAEMPPLLAGSARAMADYLPRVTHPDGEIALLNDSVFAEAPSPAAMRAFSRRVLDGEREVAKALAFRQTIISAGLDGVHPASAGAPQLEGRDDGGVVRLEDRVGEHVLLLDVGPACPDELPAHAHADIFSFEMSVGGRRMIVDSGVGAYEAGPWREYYRSTRAHNTLSVDGEDQIECWGSFRVARRARITERTSIHRPLAWGVTACHDGYARLREPVLVRRTVLRIDDVAWLIVDRLDGHGIHSWQSCLHAAPDVAITSEPSDATFSTERHAIRVAWFGFEDALVARGRDVPRQGWYAPEFGKHLPAPVLVLSGAGAVPAECGYVMASEPRAQAVRVERTARGLSVTVGQTEYLATLSGPNVSVEKRLLS
jgi:uncharacterized heparinase superfamily protein